MYAQVCELNRGQYPKAWHAYSTKQVIVHSDHDSWKLQRCCPDLTQYSDPSRTIFSQYLSYCLALQVSLVGAENTLTPIQDAKISTASPKKMQTTSFHSIEWNQSFHGYLKLAYSNFSLSPWNLAFWRAEAVVAHALPHRSQTGREATGHSQKRLRGRFLLRKACHMHCMMVPAFRKIRKVIVIEIVDTKVQ